MGKLLLNCLLILVLAAPALAIEKTSPAEQQPTGVVEKLGEFLPGDAVFTTSEGKEVTLGEIVDKPTIVLPVYYTCPRVCSFDMANLALALQQTSIPPENFGVITMSFNPEEKNDDAALAKKNYTAMLAEDFPTTNWHFLVGSNDNILKVTEAMGYSFNIAEDGLFIHPSALVAVGKDLKIIKYVYGSFLSGDVDLAIAEAEKGTPATSIKRFLAYCLSSDGKQNRMVFQILRISVITLVLTGGFFLFRVLGNRKNTEN